MKINEHYIQFFPLKIEKKVNIEEIIETVNSYASILKDVDAIIIDAKNIFDERQILIAAEMALRSYKKKNMISKKLGVEIMLYLSGQRQIVNAIKTFGINNRTLYSFLIIVSPKIEKIIEFKRKFIEKYKNKISFIPLSNVYKEKIKEHNVLKTFNISEREINSTFGKDRREKILKCIVSRMAMLNLEK